MISKLLSWKCFLFHENESHFHVGLEFSTTWRQISWDHWWLFIGCVLTPSPIYTGAACALLFRAEKDTGKRSGIHGNTSATSLPQPHWLAELRFSNGKERSRHYCPRCNEQRRTDPTGGWKHSPPRSGRNEQRRNDPTGGWRHSPPRSGRNEQRRTDPTGGWRHSPPRNGRNKQRRTDPTGRWRHSPPRNGRNKQRRTDPTGRWRHSPPRNGRNKQRRTDPTGGWRHSPPRNGRNKQWRTDPTGGWRHSPPRNGCNKQWRTDPTGGWRHSPPRSGRNEQRRTDPTGGWRHSPPRSGHHSKPASFVFFKDKAEVYLCLWFGSIYIPDSFRCTELHSAVLNMFQLATAEFSSVSNRIRCKIFGSSVQRVKKLDQSSRSTTWWWRHHHSNPESADFSKTLAVCTTSLASRIAHFINNPDWFWCN